MTLLLVFLFPAMFFVMVGTFIYKWNKAVKAGIFEKGTLKHVMTKNFKKNETQGHACLKTHCTCGKNSR